MKLVLFILSLASQTGWATLGEHEDTISSDKVKLNATRQSVRQHFRYSTHELNGPINTITQYVNQQGIVFAIRWQGVKRPDLSILLGSYHQEYYSIDSARSRMVTREPVEIKTSRIIVRKSGHMRDIRGFAYIPEQVPTDINVEDLQ